ncbi:MAG: hypothetical protein VB025_08760 [Sphaerochaeta sp.]|jgi:ABC-2 type transport system permease protein|nr:hypothetical protein [Sphaerochaeta sp.]PKL29647.1 MAG: hypothetical protein CVV46_00845 [Spirochaetae bacterium HGW-Spirochaetae-2]
MKLNNIRLLLRAAGKGDSRWEQFVTISLESKKSNSRKKSRLVIQVVIALSILLAAGSMAFMLGVNYYQMEILGSIVGIDGFSWFMGAVTAALITFMFGMFSGGSVLYHGKDLPLLLVLPLTQRELLISRLILHYKANFFMHTILFLPAVAVAIHVHGISFPIIVAALVQITIAPFIPLSLSLIVLHLFVKGKKHTRKSRESWAIIFMLTLLVVMQGLASRWMQSGMDSSNLENFANSFGIVLQGLQRILLFPKWQMSMALGPHSFVNGLYFLLAVAAITIGAIYLVATAYGETVTRLWETSTTVRKNNGKSSRSYTGHYALEWSLVRREYAIINEHSAFKMELYGEAVIPLILVVVYAISGVIGEFKVMLEPVFRLDTFPMIVTGALLLTSSLSMMSGTSYSREGKLLALSRTMPLEGASFVRGKMAAHLMLFYSTYLIFSLAALAIFRLELVHAVWMMPLGFFAVGSSACFGLAIDGRNPRLDWKLPQQAVKQNLNGLAAMGISFANIAVLAGLGYLLAEPIGLSALSSGLLLVAPSACIWWLSWKLAVSGARRLYQAQ